jgi:hypothetical protein
MSENYITCKLIEDENGENHKIEVDATWKDSHHFLDMVAAIVEKWRLQDHVNA